MCGFVYKATFQTIFVHVFSVIVGLSRWQYFFKKCWFTKIELHEIFDRICAIIIVIVKVNYYLE